jgi:hypothetical protein
MVKAHPKGRPQRTTWSIQLKLAALSQVVDHNRALSDIIARQTLALSPMNPVRTGVFSCDGPSRNDAWVKMQRATARRAAIKDSGDSQGRENYGTNPA